MKYKKGFTISEISLSMVFVSILLLAIAALVMFSSNLYQKGLALRAVNNAGIEFVDELTRSLSSSRTTSISGVYVQAKGDVYLVKNNNSKVSSVPYWGVFCTGSYSYVWNSGYVLDHATYRADTSGTSLANKRLKITVGSKVHENFRMLRFNDSTREICINKPDTTHGAPTSPNINAPNVTSPREMFSAYSENQLAIYDFKVFTPTYHSLTGHTFFTGSFVIGTLKGSVDITTTSDVCKEPPDGLNTDFAYCAINKFNFAVRATGAN